MSELLISTIILYWNILKKQIETDSQDSGVSDSNKITLSKARADIANAFLAGTKTAAQAVESCILYLGKFGVEYQNSLLDEINSVLDELITMKNTMSQTLIILQNFRKFTKVMSLVYEVLRVNVIFTSGRTLLHDELIEFVDKTGEKRRYNIPKGTTVFGNGAAINYDEDYWRGITKQDNNYYTDPFNFDPTRYINPETNTLMQQTETVFWGVGKRFCIGQQLAIKQLCVVIVLLIQQYTFSVASHHHIPRLMIEYTAPISVHVEKR